MATRFTSLSPLKGSSTSSCSPPTLEPAHRQPLSFSINKILGLEEEGKLHCSSSDFGKLSNEFIVFMELLDCTTGVIGSTNSRFLLLFFFLSFFILRVSHVIPQTWINALWYVWGCIVKCYKSNIGFWWGGRGETEVRQNFSHRFRELTNSANMVSGQIRFDSQYNATSRRSITIC